LQPDRETARLRFYFSLIHLPSLTARVLVQAPRTNPRALVADLYLEPARDGLELFPFLTTRPRPTLRHLSKQAEWPDE